MRLGFFGANVGPMATPAAGDVCAYAEELGYHSMWTGEHMVLPVHRPDYLNIPADWAFADPLVMFGFLAARTSHIELCTGCSCCRSGTRCTWPRSWPHSMFCAAAGCGSASASGTSRPRWPRWTPFRKAARLGRSNRWR